MRVNVDTNACIRYLLDDIPEQAERTEALIDEGSAYLTPEVLAECAFVLEKVYEIGRQEMATGLRRLIELMGCDSKEVYLRAVSVFAGNRKLDMVDSFLIARKLVLGDDVLSFDKDMMKVLHRLESSENPAD